jgi:phosphonate transport system permease protein
MTASGLPPIPRPPQRPLADRLFDLVIWGGIVVLLMISFEPVQMTHVIRIFTQSGNMREYGRDFLRPDFSDWRTYVSLTWQTVQRAIWGTFLAFLVAVPLSFLAARNVAPIWVWLPTRRVLDLMRAAPDIVVGALFIVAVGVGPTAGVLALAVNTGGVLGKLFSEAVEQIERGPVEGVRATGAAPLQELVWGVLPQVAPLWTSYGLYRFESAARSATVLGLIGAGGIGQALLDSLNGFQYKETSAIAIIVFAAVVCVDSLSQIIRTRLT